MSPGVVCLCPIPYFPCLVYLVLSIILLYLSFSTYPHIIILVCYVITIPCLIACVFTGNVRVYVNSHQLLCFIIHIPTFLCMSSLISLVYSVWSHLHLYLLLLSIYVLSLLYCLSLTVVPLYIIIFIT